MKSTEYNDDVRANARIDDEYEEYGINSNVQRSTLAMDAVFDHERLDVYQQELAFIAWVTPLLEEVKDDGGAKTREVCDQLDRGSLSALLNTAEGNGKRQQQVRAKFFDDARGSATECAACLDALVAKRLCEMERVQEGKQILIRIVQMLTKLVARYSDDHVLREEEAEYRFT